MIDRPYTTDDIWTVARTIYGEARGTSRKDRIGVAWVIRNRVHDRRWPNAWSAACKQRLQFSCWNRGEPNNHPMLAADLDDPVFAECFAIAAAVMAGIDPDPTRGANHYHALSMPSPPYWADPNRETGRLGGHAYYNL